MEILLFLVNHTCIWYLGNHTYVDLHVLSGHAMGVNLPACEDSEDPSTMTKKTRYIKREDIGLDCILRTTNQRLVLRKRKHIRQTLYTLYSYTCSYGNVTCKKGWTETRSAICMTTSFYYYLLLPLSRETCVGNLDPRERREKSWPRSTEANGLLS